MQASPLPLWLRFAPLIFLIFWSSGYPVSKLGMGYAAPFSFLALRYAMVLLILAPIALVLRPPLPRRRIDFLHLAVVGFGIQTVYFGGCYEAFANGTSAAAVALIVSLQPILVAVLAPLLVGERVRTGEWAGLGLGFAGALLVITAYQHAANAPLIGVVSSVAALFGMSGATLYEKRYGVTQHAITANLVQYSVGLITTLPLALAFGFHAVPSLVFMGVVLYLVIANSIISISLYLAMVRHGLATQVSALLYLVPPITALMSWVLLREPLPVLAWAGMALAGLGVALTRWQGKRATS